MRKSFMFIILFLFTILFFNKSYSSSPQPQPNSSSALAESFSTEPQTRKLQMIIADLVKLKRKLEMIKDALIELARHTSNLVNSNGKRSHKDKTRYQQLNENINKILTGVQRSQKKIGLKTIIEELREIRKDIFELQRLLFFNGSTLNQIINGKEQEKAVIESSSDNINNYEDNYEYDSYEDMINYDNY